MGERRYLVSLYKESKRIIIRNQSETLVPKVFFVSILIFIKTYVKVIDSLENSNVKDIWVGIEGVCERYHLRLTTGNLLQAAYLKHASLVASSKQMVLNESKS